MRDRRGRSMKSSGRISCQSSTTSRDLGEEAVAADVEAEAVMLDRAADAPDIMRVLLDHDDRGRLPGEAIGGGEPGRARPDDEDLGIVAHARSAPALDRSSPRR